MRRLWQIAMGVSLAVVLFFAATLVLPLTTVGDPAYDIPMLRARWYGEFYVFALHGLAVILMAVLAAFSRSGWAGLAVLLSAASLYAMLTEEARFIRYGDLIGPSEAAMARLALSRLVTLALSAAALAALWRSHVRG